MGASVSDIGGVGPLCDRGAAVLPVVARGELGGAGHVVAVDPAVKMDGCGLGGHGG